MQGRMGRRGAHRHAAALALCCALVGAPLAAQAFLRAAPVSEMAAAEPQGSVPADTPASSAPPGAGNSAGGRSPLYDPTNPDLERLQVPREALQGLPRDRDDKIDWMKALRSKEIVPRGKLEADGPHLAIDLDIIMRNTREMPWVRFPHRAHSEWLDCSNCHPVPFEPRAGSTPIKMEDIFRGRFCGQCHDRVAFVTHRNCDRCHSVPQPGGISW